MENREEAIPELLEILEYTLSDVERLSKDEDYLIQFPAVYLLAYFREKRAFGDMVRITTLPEEQAYDLLGDTITEDFGRILASVCDGNIEPIKGIIENSSLDEYVRSEALASLLVLLNDGMVSREQLVFYFKELFNGKLEVDYSDVWDSLPRICSLIHPKGLENDIRKAVEDGKVMEIIAGPDFMNRQLKRPVRDVLEELKEDESYSLISAKDVYSLEKWVGVKSEGNPDEEEDLDMEDPYEEEDLDEEDEYMGDFAGKDIDEKMRSVVLDALKRAKDYGQRMEENRLKHLWKEVDIPCSLLHAMNRLAKVNMDEIRKNYQLKDVSSLNKSELAAELARQIPSLFRKALYAMDKGIYDFLKKMNQNSGVIPDPDNTIPYTKPLLKFGIAFPGIYKEKKVLFLPTELTDIFVQTDGSELERITRRNTEWIRLVHGLLYYYGVMETPLIKKRIEELTGEEIDFFEFLNVMSFACRFHGRIGSTPYGYKDAGVFDAQKIAEERQKRPEVDYYPFTKKQLLKAGDPAYVDRTPEMNRFLRFLSDHYELTDEDLNEIASQMIHIINSGSKPGLMMKYLQSRLEFPSFEFTQALTAMITELYNHTRLWALKGHTPDELFQREKKFLKPLPKETFQAEPANDKGVNQAKRTKVGRNDPCPCGSGKKYKKCCGK